MTASVNARTRALLDGPIVPTLLSMAWPNVLVMVAQAATGLIETWFLSRLGTQALTAMALVFPGFMLMQMLSAGAVGGGISSAVARALGARRTKDADALVLHAILVNVVLGLLFSLVFLVFGSPIYRAMGGEGASLQAAMEYSNVAFGGAVLIWLMNALASVIRGTGNMLVPAIAVCGGVALLIPLSPLLIFGFGPVPAMGMAGGAAAVLISNALSTLYLAWYLWSGRSVVHPRRAQLNNALIRDIMRVGGIGSINTVHTTLVFVLATSLVGMAGGPAAVAGYGTAARLEYLLIPLVFGVGAPLVALVGTNVGAGQRALALRVALTGGAIAFLMSEAIGIAAAIWPHAWLGLFGDDPVMLEVGTKYLRIVGPTFGFFGLGLAMYFASQGAGRLLWPLVGSAMRLAVGIGGGWLVLWATNSLEWLFLVLAVAMVLYGIGVTAAIRGGVWFRTGESDDEVRQRPSETDATSKAIVLTSSFEVLK